MAPTPVLYDADCRFCRAVLALLLAWDRRGRLRPVALQSEEAGRLLPDLSPDARMASMHAVLDEGRAVSGGAAFPPLLREVPGGSPLATIAARFPRAAQVVYTCVAENRSLLSKLVPRAASRKADALVTRRSA